MAWVFNSPPQFVAYINTISDGFLGGELYRVSVGAFKDPLKETRTSNPEE
jgi:hypothetical protein